MNTHRDSYLRLEVRKQNWVRLEFYKRFIFQNFLYRRATLRVLRAESSLSRWQKVAINLELARLPKQSRSTKHTTRCRVTGRAKQAFRNLQLARMEFRRAMREGTLSGLRLERS